MMKWLRDCFTEDDAGQIWSLVHAIAATGFVTFIGLSIYHVVTSHAFDPQAYGMGFGGVMGGAGGAIFANSRSGTTKADGTPK